MIKKLELSSDQINSLTLIYTTKIAVQVTFDAIAIAFSFIGALLLRLSFDSWLNLLPISLSYLPITVVAGIIVFWSFGFYRTLWRYASVDAIWLITGASFTSVAISALIINFLHPKAFPWSIFVIQWMGLASIVGGSRMMIRYLRRRPISQETASKKRILIYGAGDAGEMIARDILHSRTSEIAVVGFIDDDPLKLRKSLHGLPIFGGIESADQAVKDYEVQEIVIAMPSLAGVKVRELLHALRDQIKDRIEIRTLPPISELVSGKVSFKQIRSFDVVDLLRRDPIELDLKRVERIIKGKCVLVSGAGGSIGSEICLQVARCKPNKMVLYDISEPNLYTICESVNNEFPDLPIVPVVGDIGHRWLADRVFDEHKPNVVFHAAAYKHVPLMEDNPLSALVNNVIGTRVLAAVSAEHKVERFVMISTDKAVRPTNMMGATKRLCEMLVESQPHHRGSVYCTVRFGNVMGSSGSVIPRFERQIAAGGPVTVTHPEITRYFMLTSEAVQLVLQTATLEGDYATYFLDMGEPVKISELARDMISLHGLTPDKDIEIVYTELRPGEKLYEELCHTGDGSPTNINKIWIADTPLISREKYLCDLDELLENCYSMDRRNLYLAVAKLVPDFQPEIKSLDPKALQIGGQTDKRIPGIANHKF